ncbi:hypothetical protein OW495_02305 [Vibrio sp. 14N.309.X.WAT.E.F5]|uniref:hypothetical protein n=1 Tax=Vibrio TaxID=662 RepID=UPI0009769620|nr:MULTISPECIES: hypothetical protein [Vibrio]MDH5925553.1 hypothetical protein [Vibrio lentus]MDN2665528.1 hypothetical protein [Vibrio sp. 14N.309.X.WAT.E.F5]OMO20741.1 hypothetical protein BH583_15480 [Vibrio lentus]PMI64451.1 hypothetical protein BCU40_15890 [Vibrio lentus]PMJ87330.1 hypothetical protein BCU13_10965 [Vibrio lentus]
MYGSEQTRAFCCNCKVLTLHKYTMFSNQVQKAPQKAKKPGLIQQILSSLVSNNTTGDYKCTKCGTYLRTPDNLD